MNLKPLPLISALVLAANTAQANDLATVVQLTNAGANQIQYVNFEVLNPGSFDIHAWGSASQGFGYINDPQIHLFTSPASYGNWLASDDDSGGNLQSWIAGINLNTGNYVLAASSYPFFESNAITGIKNYNAQAGLLDITISSATGTAQLAPVPLPAATWLFASALLTALGIGKNRKVI